MSDRLNIELTFDQGTVVARVRARDVEAAEELFEDPWVWDDRVSAWRCPAYRYREAYMPLHRAAAVQLQDKARAYESLELARSGVRVPRDYQKAAVDAWWDAGQRGVVVLPTGAGKSFVAHLIMERVGRSTLIVVPTLDLMHQWYSNSLETFGLDGVGLIGGGEHEPRPVTITTYDSARIHMERYGARYGLVVFDECHHLPGPAYALAAQSMLAPFRLGLTATPERQDGGHERNDDLIGPIVYRERIRDLSGAFLSDYGTETVRVELTASEREEYEHERQVYLDFVRSNRISFGGGRGWGQFIALTSRSSEGRRAMRAYQRQREIALSCSAKLKAVEDLLERHRDERAIVFTHENDMVYRLSRRHLLPAITHQTPTRERREILQRFNAGEYRTVVTSRVLNEGVDVPEASVAIVLSGSGTVREHVQRLGRILRRSEGKSARLYELISADTVEERVSTRRREHDAYDGERQQAEEGS